MKKLEEYFTKKIIYTKDNYPNKLKQIKNYPIMLFYKGNIELLNTKCIAIIGNRDFSEYGKKIAIKFSYELASRGITIVTGGARGIDSFANMGANLANSPSIIVLGNSLEFVYPPENKELEEKVLNNNGLIISEYMPGTRGNKYTFPARNRIISAISDGILVIEAKKKSGTTITVDYALEQGKDIYAVPGNITHENSEGTNDLIKQGAKMATSINDILEDYIN